MSRINGPIKVYNPADTVPTDAEGGYAGGDSTAAAVATAGAQALAAQQTIQNLQGAATTLPPGSAATVTVTGSGTSKVINVGVPKGEPGMGYAEGQALVADAAQSAADADAAATRAENAEAAKLEVPDANVTALVGNPVSQLAQALSVQQPAVPATLYGMATSKTGTQNKAALLAAIAAAAGRPVFIPAGTFNVDKIGPSDFTGAARLVGTGARVATSKRWTLGSASWATDGPTGTVLRCASTLLAGEPFIDVGNADAATSTSLRDLALLGQGGGVGLRAGAAVPANGGGHPVRWDFQGVTVANFDVGMTHTGENGVLVAPYIVGCGDGFYAGYPFNGNTVLGINVERVTRSAIRLDHAITNVFLGGVLQGSYPTLATILLENGSHGNVFEAIYSENYAPTTGTHTNTLYEVHVGTSGSACYGNVFRNMHWGSQTAETPASRIVVANAYFTQITMEHSPSGTIQPTVELNGGWGHEVVGLFPAVTGAAVASSKVRLTTGALAASDVTDIAPWNIATKGFLRTGSSTTIPGAATAGAGAIFRDQASTLLMDSDGTGWAPVVARIRPMSNGASGTVNLGGIPGWMAFTHLRFTAAAGLTLWAKTAATVDRSFFIRNGKASGDITVGVQPGETLNGTLNGTVAIPPGGGLWFVVSTNASNAWVSA